jgi:prepilin-type N-terminal cleavage/methylation domain-containing protein
MRRSARGFTLIELLVSLGIFAVMAASLGSSLSTGVAAWKRARRMADRQQEARAVLEGLARELRAAIPLAGKNFQGDEKSLSFYTARDTPSADGGPLREVVRIAYGAALQNPAGPTLDRTESPARGEGSDERRRSLTVPGGEARFGYAYAAVPPDELPLWKPRWAESNDLPAAVRVTLKVKDAVDGTEEVFVKTVPIPLGVLKAWKE